MLREIFLKLSANKTLRHWMESSFAAKAITERFVAGIELRDGLTVARELSGRQIQIALDHLGENVSTAAVAGQAGLVALASLSALCDLRVNGTIAVKLTQLGVDLSERACEKNAAVLVQAAASSGGFVRIDMESSQYTDRTLSIVKRLHGQYGSCGTVIQAYLRRSSADVHCLENERIRVRLCKGAYLEKPDVAFAEKGDVDRNYLDLARSLLSSGGYPAIATHDERIVNEVERYSAEKGIGPDRFEFQMLYGIRRDLQRRLVKEGHRLRLYVPFGEAWYPYFMRRLAERPANLLFFLRHALRS